MTKEAGNRSDQISLFDTVGKRAERDGIYVPKRILFCSPIRHYSRKFRYLGDPPTIFFAVKFYRK